MKVQNCKFQGFAYNIIAESLRTWSQKSKFIKEKLEQKLSKSDEELDNMDLRIADVYFNRCNTSENEIELGQSSRRGNVSQVNETQTLSKKTISGQNLSNR